MDKTKFFITGEQMKVVNDALKTHMNWQRFKIVVLVVFILTAVLCLGWIWIS